MFCIGRRECARAFYYWLPFVGLYEAELGTVSFTISANLDVLSQLIINI